MDELLDRALNAAVGGSWLSYSTPIDMPLNHTLYAYAEAAGLTNSPIVRHDSRRQVIEGNL